MKKTVALICAFFVMFFGTAQAAHTGADIYNGMEMAFNWLKSNVSPLGDTNSVAADYYVMAMSRADKTFAYDKYKKITASRTNETVRDAQRCIMANTASGGSLSDAFVAENTYNADLNRAADKADAICAILSGEYKIKSKTTDIDKLAVGLVSMQNTDGSFDGDVLSTSKSIIALSFLSGRVYTVKGEEQGEKYRYDINSAILRGVDYLQNAKNEDFGFGSVKNTAFAIMALDAAGVDADNDPGFSDGEKSTLGALMNAENPDGSFGEYADNTALAACALVSHLRAMQGNSGFFALRTEDMPYNPSDYAEDINRSGEGLKSESVEEIEIKTETSEIKSDTGEKPYELNATQPADTQTLYDQKKTPRVLAIAVVIAAIIMIALLSIGFVAYVIYVRPRKRFHMRKTDDSDDDCE